MPHRRPRHRSSSLRRLRYALFRVGYVGWRALWREEAAWHALVGVAIALGCATGIVMWDRQGGLPLAVYALPVAEATVFTVLAALALATSWFTHRWNEKHRPREFRRYCPRCGYDMTQSPHRCPECGLRKMKLPPSQEAWW